MIMLRIVIALSLLFSINFKQNSTIAQTDYELRSQIAKELDLAAKRPQWRAACDNDDAEACMTLADWIRTTSPRDDDRALLVDLYTKACEAEIAQACDSLGRVYNLGIGTAQNLSLARVSYEKGCDLGLTRACAAFGNLLYTAGGGERDLYKGGSLLKQACTDGFEWACARGCILGVQGEDRCFSKKD